MSQKSYFLFSVFFAGAIIGAFFLLLSIAIGHFWNIKGWYDFSKDQGATLAAFVTVGTIIAVWWIHHNEMNTQNKIREDSRTRRVFTFRARLSDELIDLLPYTRASFNHIRNRSTVPFPDRPRQSIGFLIDGINDVDPVSYNTLSELISDYQVHHARVNSDRSVIGRDDNDIYDTACLHAKFLGSFGYARHIADELSFENFTMRDFASALRDIMGEDFYTLRAESNRLYEMIEEQAVIDRRWPNITKPTV